MKTPDEDLRTAQVELQRLWQYLAEAQSLSHSGTFGWKVTSGELVWSDETYRIWGFTKETNLTLDLVFERIHPEERDRMQQLRVCAEQQGVDLDIEHRILLPDGIIKYVHVVAHPGRDGAGNLEYMGVVTDMTERRQADEERQALAQKLAESNARLEEAERVAHLGYWIWDLQTNHVIFSNETCRIYGLKPQEDPIDLAVIRELIHPEDREYVFQNAERAVRDGVRIETEHRLIRPNGEVRFVHSPGDLKKDASGRPCQMFGTCQDITERKQAEEERHALSRDLQASTARLEEAQRVAHIGHYEWDLIANRVTWSDELYHIYGLRPQQGPIDVAIVSEMIHPDDREQVFRTAEESVLSGMRTEVKHRVIRPDGEVRTVQGLGTLKRDVSGRAYEMFGTVQDITERKSAEEALQRTQFYLSEGERIANIGSWACNLVTREIFHSSDENVRLYGFDPSKDPIPFDLYYGAILPEDERAIRSKLENAISAGDDYDVEFRIRRTDGAIRFLHGIGHHNPSQEIGEYFGITIDITDRKHAEEERERLRQLEAEVARTNRVNMMGELAAALSHEIKQPIAASITSANALLRWLAHDPPDLERARAAAARIEQDGNRAAEVINSLRSFYQTGMSAERQVVDLKQVIGEMAVLLRAEADRHAIAIQQELNADAPRLFVNRVQLQQVLMNLMLNAIEAMKDTGGEMRIKTNVDPDGLVLVSVSDTGVGLKADSTEKIFEPFHTTKQQGTGMGLTISRSIVESYGGRVWAKANHGPGATFHFTIPGETEDRI